MRSHFRRLTALCAAVVTLTAGGLSMNRRRVEPAFAAGDASLFWVETVASPSGEPTVSVEPSATVEPSPSIAPAPTDEPAFRLEVVRAEPVEVKRVLIYHTHTYEAYRQVEDKPYAETEKWRTADAENNVTRVGAELASLLRGMGVEVTHDTTAFEPPKLSASYQRSLEMLVSRQAAGERYDLYVDLHRDAYTEGAGGALTIGGMPTARLMLLIGKGEGQTDAGLGEKPQWEANLAIAQRLTEALNMQADGLCRPVCVKSGRYNQHVAVGCVLVEVGNNRNSLAEALAAMPYLADAIHETLR